MSTNMTTVYIHAIQTYMYIYIRRVRERQRDKNKQRESARETEIVHSHKIAGYCESEVGTLLEQQKGFRGGVPWPAF